MRKRILIFVANANELFIKRYILVKYAILFLATMIWSCHQEYPVHIMERDESNVQIIGKLTCNRESYWLLSIEESTSENNLGVSLMLDSVAYTNVVRSSLDLSAYEIHKPIYYILGNQTYLDSEPNACKIYDNQNNLVDVSSIPILIMDKPTLIPQKLKP